MPRPPGWLAACLQTRGTAADVDAEIRGRLPCAVHTQRRAPCEPTAQDCAYDDGFVWDALLCERVDREAPALLTLGLPPAATTFGLPRAGGEPPSCATIPPQATARGPRAWGQAAVWLGLFAPAAPALTTSLELALRPSLSLPSLAHYHKHCVSDVYRPELVLTESLRQALHVRSPQLCFASEHSWLLPPILFEMKWLKILDVYLPTLKTLEGPWEQLIALEQLVLRGGAEVATLSPRLGQLVQLKSLSLHDFLALETLACVTPGLVGLRDLEIYGGHRLGDDADAVRSQLFEPDLWSIVSNEKQVYGSVLRLRRS